MLIGIQAWGLISGFIFSVARAGYAVGWRSLNYDWKTHGVALPVTLFTAIQVIAFVASIAALWWMIVRKGSKIRMRIAPWLQHRRTFVVLCIVFCLLASFIHILSGSLTPLLFWAYGREKVQEAMLYSSYANLWVSPFEMAAAVAATLLLARKRLHRLSV